jgi:hypothetical protein
MTRTIKPPQCSHRPDLQDRPMLQFDARPVVPSNPFHVNGKQLLSRNRDLFDDPRAPNAFLKSNLMVSAIWKP